jgi:hypothetical protein
LHSFQILDHVHLLKEMVAFIKVRIESEKAPPIKFN